MLPKNKRFSADGQNTAQNYTTMRVVVAMQFWTAVCPPEEDDCSQPPEEDLKPILHKEIEISSSVTAKRGSLLELIIHQQNLFKLAGRP